MNNCKKKKKIWKKFFLFKIFFLTNILCSNWKLKWQLLLEADICYIKAKNKRKVKKIFQYVICTQLLFGCFFPFSLSLPVLTFFFVAYSVRVKKSKKTKIKKVKKKKKKNRKDFFFLLILKRFRKKNFLFCWKYWSSFFFFAG